MSCLIDPDYHNRSKTISLRISRSNIHLNESTNQSSGVSTTIQLTPELYFNPYKLMYSFNDLVFIKDGTDYPIHRAKVFFPN